MTQLSLKIFGDVHGVNFRWYTKQAAAKLGIVGWVRNDPDGSVEVLAQGEEDALRKLKEWCEKGPRFARVDRVEEEWREMQELYFSRFEIQ